MRLRVMYRERETREPGVIRGQRQRRGARSGGITRRSKKNTERECPATIENSGKEAPSKDSRWREILLLLFLLFLLFLIEVVFDGKFFGADKNGNLGPCCSEKQEQQEQK